MSDHTYRITLHRADGSTTVGRLVALDVAGAYKRVDVCGVEFDLVRARPRQDALYVSREHGYATSPRAWPGKRGAR